MLDVPSECLQDTCACIWFDMPQDAVTGDFVFEAGAVVLGDRGLCCVDEFDKMTNEHQASRLPSHQKVWRAAQLSIWPSIFKTDEMVSMHHKSHNILQQPQGKLCTMGTAYGCAGKLHTIKIASCCSHKASFVLTLQILGNSKVHEAFNLHQACSSHKRASKSLREALEQQSGNVAKGGLVFALGDGAAEHDCGQGRHGGNPAYMYDLVSYMP
eukprot:1155033-Pelagomonas_calceolata.AAC.9